MAGRFSGVTGGPPDPALILARGAAAPFDTAELSSESVIIFDTAGTVQYWNPASEALYGWPALAMVGRGIDQLSEQDAHEGEHWKMLVQEGAWQGLVSRRTASGKRVAVDVRQYVRFHGDGRAHDVLEYGRRAGAGIGPGNNEWQIPDRLMAASWEVDIGETGPWVAAINEYRRTGRDGDPAHLTTLCLQLLQATRVVNVNKRASRRPMLNCAIAS